MSRIIINNESGLEDEDVLSHIHAVVKKGKISNGTYGKQYCHIVTFSDSIIVSASVTKSGTDTFLILKEGN